MKRATKPTKAKVTPNPVPRRTSGKREATRRRQLETELAEAVEQQRATTEILRVIRESPTDVQPVFDAIATSATRLCDAANSGVFRFDGTLIHLVAHHNWDSAELSAVRQAFPLPPGRGSLTARAILSRAVAHADIALDPEFALHGVAGAGFRTTLSVPMLRGGEPIGAITVTRMESRPFTEMQINLLRTFADQAGIAIENVRLFQERERATVQRTGSTQS
jgi:two-component system, NtrC family, sensor kinase